MGSSLRNGKAVTIRPIGLSDSADGSNAFSGAMSKLQDFVPSMTTKGLWQTRPALVTLADVTTYLATATFLNFMTCYGSLIVGMATVNTDNFLRPFMFNLLTNAFVPIANATVNNTPSIPSGVPGTPPIIFALVGQRIVVVGNGFPSGDGSLFGWIDFSGFSDATVTGTTHTSTLIDALSTNVLIEGWQVGFRITGAGIPVNTFIQSIAVGGLSIVLTQATTAAAGGVALTVTGGTKAAPLWGAGNTNGNALIAAPTAVAQFNGRAWYAVPGSSNTPPAIVFSDALNAVQVTNASQALTMQNGLNVTALAGLPLSSPVSGGVIQSLIGFQGSSAMLQITGDQATTNLAMNWLNINTGTNHPLSICPCSEGLAFMSPSGLRMLDFSGVIGEVIGLYGAGVAQPFTTPTHSNAIAIAYAQDTLRITISGTTEYLYSLTQKFWYGPHTTKGNCLASGTISLTANPIFMNNGFILSSFEASASTTGIYFASILPTGASSYVEFGNNIGGVYQTVLSADNEDMCMQSLVEATLMFVHQAAGGVTGVVLLCQLFDEAGNQLGECKFTNPNLIAGLRQNRLGFLVPITFKQMLFRATVTGDGNLWQIGNFRYRAQQLEYLLQDSSTPTN